MTLKAFLDLSFLLFPWLDGWVESKLVQRGSLLSEQNIQHVKTQIKNIWKFLQFCLKNWYKLYTYCIKQGSKIAPKE